MSRILLTGASGYLGTQLRPALVAQGHAVLATDMRPAPDGTPTELADLADAAAIDALMAQQPDAVLHLGGMANEGDWDLILRANIMGCYNIFEAARRHGVRRVIYASSYHVAGFYPTAQAPLPVDVPFRPDTLYGVSKAFGETWPGSISTNTACNRYRSASAPPIDRKRRENPAIGAIPRISPAWSARR